MKTYEIPENLVITILNYLTKKPHGEVDALIKGIQQIKPISNEQTKILQNGQ